MTQAGPQQADVLSHYREIAGGYNARANQTCERTYRRLVDRFMRAKPRLLELGGGSSDLLESLASPTAVACDLSREMLLMRPRGDRSHRVVAVGERLPFGGARFDGVFSINVLEHVVDLERVLAESVRVLADGGLWLAVTPNGNWEGLLDLAERWSLKIPEGPHRFLTTRQLRQAVTGTWMSSNTGRSSCSPPARRHCRRLLTPSASAPPGDGVSSSTSWPGSGPAPGPQ